MDAVDYSVVIDTLDVSEANLSKTIRNLIELGYLRTLKQTSPQRADSRLTTVISLTAQGRAAFDGHLAALMELAHTQGP